MVLSPNQAFFIVGDVHGCWHTFEALLKHWRPDSERLLLLGDLINKGPHSLKVLDEFKVLSQSYGALALRGNHEHEWLKYLKNPKHLDFYNLLKPLIQAYQQANRNPLDDITWIETWPIYYQNDFLFISHAGWSLTCQDLNKLDDWDSLVWTRGPLRRLSRLQIIGHRPQELAHYRAEEHCYYLDTGAFMGRALSALKLGADGEILGSFSEPTHQLDKKT